MRLHLATAATVVPAKAGIQEIPGERTSRLPKVLDSGFCRDDGALPERRGINDGLPERRVYGAIARLSSPEIIDLAYY